MWCSVRVFGNIRVRAVKCTIERLGGVRERELGAVWEFLNACDWEFSSAKVSGEGTGFRVEEVYEQELELCESFWRRTIENSQVQERLVIVRLKVFEVHDFELKCSYSMQNSQFCNAMIFNATPPKHQVCVHTTLQGGNSLTLNPISAAGWWNPPFLQVFLSPSPQISIDQL